MFFILLLIVATLLNAQEIKKIEFVGLTKISSNIANETIDFKIGDKIDIDKIDNAIKKFYKFGYFKDIFVTNEAGIVTFNFKEKPVVANVKMLGYKEGSNDLNTLYSKIGIKKGSLFSKKRLENAKKILLNELETEGYVHSVIEIDIKNINENSLSLVFNVNKGEKIIIKKVNYFGSQKLNKNDFENITANKKEGLFPWLFSNDGKVKIDQLEYDQKRIKNLYLENGYLNSIIKSPFMRVDFSSNNAVLDFFIEEGKQYTTNEIQIFIDEKILNAKNLYPKLLLKKEKIFNIALLRKDIEFIKTSIIDLGYAFAQVNYNIKKEKTTSKVDVSYSVIPGEKVYINDVIISGNTITLDRVIRRDIYLASGDLFSATDLKDTKNRLQRGGFFESVTIDQKKISDNKIDLYVKVKEAHTGSLSLGGGYGSYEGLVFIAGITNRNIFGSGKSVGANVDFSKHKHDLNLFLKNPSINDSKYNGSVDIYNQTQEIDYSNPNYSFEKKSVGFSLGVGNQVFRDTFIGASYTLQRIRESYTDKDTNDSYNPFNFKKNEDYKSSSIKPYITYNSTDSYFFPKSGIKASTSIEFAGIGGDARYIKSFSNYKYFYSLEEKLDLDITFRYKTSLRFLIDKGKITQGDSFYLGGTSSLRGYESYAFGPDNDSNEPALKKISSNSLELSFPISPQKLRWNLFYDYGMIGEKKIDEIRRSSTGISIEWISPLGPIQFIFAKPLNEAINDKTSRFEFSLGQSF